MRLPPLNTLRFFEAAARHGNLSRAADELCVTQSAVSRQIRQLEDALGVILFDRRNRTVFLTTEGKQLQNTCNEIFEKLYETVSCLGMNNLSSPLVVSCEPTIMMRWLIPRLPEFHSCHPEIQIHLFAAGGPIDFAKSHVDMALRRDDFTWEQELHTVHVGDELVGPVTTPYSDDEQTSYRSRHMLHALTRPDAWKQWMKKTGKVIANEEQCHSFEHFYIMLEAASAGLGIGISSLYMAERELDHGRLIAPEGFIPDGSAYYMLSPMPFEADPRKTAFTRWLCHMFQESRKKYGSLNDKLEYSL